MEARGPEPSGAGAVSGPIRWHKIQTADGTPSWDAERDGSPVANAAMTGRPGTDNYPWDWYIEPGISHMGPASGVCDTLRSCKERVRYALAQP